MRATLLSAVAVFLCLGWTGGPGRAAKAKPSKPKTREKPAANKLATDNPPEISRKSDIGGKTFDEWMADLKDPDPAIVENAIRTIILFGKDLAQEAVPVLVRKLDKPNLDISIKVNTAIFLGMIGLDAVTMDDGVRGLKRMLRSDQVIVKLHATLALARVGNDAKETIDLLRSNLFHYSWEIRKASALALATVAQPRSDKFPPDKLVVSRLLDCACKDKCSQVRVEAARALVMLGAPPDERRRVADRLSPVAQRYRDKTVRIWAHVAIMRVSTIEEKRLEAIGNMLDDPVLGVRCEAARVLGMIGPDAKSQVNKLRRVLKQDSDPIMRKAVVATLADMGDAAKPAVKDLEAFASTITDKNMKEIIDAAIKAIKAPKKDRRD